MRPSPGRIEAVTDRRGLFLHNQAFSRPPTTTTLPRSMNNNGYCLRNGEKQGKIDCVMIFLHHIMPDSHLSPFPEPPHCLLGSNQLPDPLNISSNLLLSLSGWLRHSINTTINQKEVVLAIKILRVLLVCIRYLSSKPYLTNQIAQTLERYLN